MNDPRGSKWRKWDLHVHAPSTKLSNGYGNPTEEVWNRFISKLENSDVYAFGITDYFSIDGYKYLKERIQEDGILQGKVIFPNIEFRLLSASNKEKDFIQIHVIFDNSLPKDEIERFLQKLNTIYKKDNGTNYTCSSEDLAEIGYEKACVHFPEIERSLQETFGNEKGYLIVGVSNGYGGIRPPKGSPRSEGIADEIDRFSDCFFGRAADRKYFLNEGRYPDAIKKAVISGSDIHSFDDLDSLLGNQFYVDGKIIRDITWIKADLTFNGLKQLIYEPELRVFIGNRPEKCQIIDSAPHLFIESISILNDSGDNHEWFDRIKKIPLNFDLVSIIGNKGSGKSALADIVSMAGNCTNESFSFLNPDKFLSVLESSKYRGLIQMRDGNPNQKPFSEPRFNWADSPKVIYLSQSFVRELCESEETSDLQNEINRVVFDHVPDELKQEVGTFNEMVARATSSLTERIDLLRLKVSDCNKKIVQREESKNPKFRESKLSSLKDKQRELETHRKNKPLEIPQPNNTSNAPTIAKIKDLRADADKLEVEIESLKREIVTVTKDEQAMKDLRDQIVSVERNVAEVVGAIDQSEVAKKYGIVGKEILTLTITTSLIVKSLDAMKIAVGAKREKRDILEASRKSLIKEIDTLQLQLSSTEKAYQSYIDRLSVWIAKEKQIIGKDSHDRETIKNLEQWIDYIDNRLDGDLKKLYSERSELASEILKLIFETRETLDEFYAGVKDYSAIIREEEGITPEEFIGFKSEIRISQRFNSSFLENVNQKHRGVFYGLESGRKELQGLVSKLNTNSIEEIASFPVLLLDRLTAVQGMGGIIEQDQLKEGVTKQSFYDFLFGFDYLETDSEITYSGKKIANLSPGEKGTLLLIFYLLMDLDRRPIIIDQPEENLDNETVFKVLVPLVKRVKSERQIIIVTHNPNLAVVCDSEQIIKSSIAKQNKNLVTYSSGSIESTKIRESVINVLEGTEAAFANRRQKYEL
jgi:ABC-type lipoprotein export system ATPase subunit